jgi:hypothetical protein
MDGGPSAATVTLTQPTHDPLTVILREHLHRLRLIQHTISVSVMALHRQNAELDHDVAVVLDHHASEPLDFEIENLETALATLAVSRQPNKVAA